MFRLVAFFRGKALWLMICSLILISLSSIFDISQPVLLMWIVSAVHVISNHVKIPIELFGNKIFELSADNAWWFFTINCILMGVIAVFSLFFGLIGFFAGSKSSLLFAQNLRNSAYKKILTYSFAELDKITNTSLITRLTNDTNQVQNSMKMIITMLIRSPIMVIGGLLVAFALQPLMGSLIICIVSLMIIVTSIIAYKCRFLYKQAQKSIDDSSNEMRENALGMRIIKTFNLQNRQSQHFNFFNRKLRDTCVKAEFWTAPIMFIIQFSLNIGIVLLLLLGGQIILNEHNLKIVTFIYGVVQIMIMVLSSSVMGIMVLALTIRTVASAKRINEIFDTECSIIDCEKPVNFNSSDYDIEFKNVSFSYTNKNTKECALSNINLKIKTGETIGIIGPTGSGKTTLINLISRLYDVTSGEVMINNVNVKKIALSELRKNISVALQEQIIFSGDIAYNLKYGKSDATDDEMIEACKYSCAWDFINKLPNKLYSRVEQRGKNFSGGQKQRICLARSLIKKPRILIFDDSTSALDLLTEKKFQSNLDKFFKNITKIIVSQKISSVKNANKIIVMDNGKIIESGSHSSLMKASGFYSMIAKSQLGIN